MSSVLSVEVEEEEREPEIVPSMPQPVLTSAELAECTCPEPCERDHDRD